MDKLRTSFDKYANLEPHKLRAAASWHLRQNQNLSIALRANEYETKFVRIRAKMDSKTTQICRSLHGRLIPVEHIMHQANGIINAKSPEEMMSYTDPHSNGVWSKKLPKNIGLPPYHFGCRTMIEEVPNALADEYMLDEFDRGYSMDKKASIKIQNKKDHLKATKYKNTQEMIKSTLESISKEGTHINDSSKKVIFGSNGCILFADKNNNILSCYPPTSKNMLSYYEKYAITYYDKLDNIMQRIKKWLGL